MPPGLDGVTPGRRGVFITFEGVEGSGKTTQVALLQSALQQAGIPVSSFREPGGTPAGEQIRSVLLCPQTPLTAAAELFLFLAARAQLVTEAVAPALQAGKWVLCDRFADSTLAYQGYARGLPLDWLKTLNRFATQDLSPDFTVLLDLDPASGLARLPTRDRMEAEGMAFHNLVRRGFLELASQEPERFLVVDALQPPHEIHRRVLDAVRVRFRSAAPIVPQSDTQHA